jgi:hypothetical protein
MIKPITAITPTILCFSMPIRLKNVSGLVTIMSETQ